MSSIEKRRGTLPNMIPSPSAIEFRGREYPCYCKMPVSELNSLPEPERAKAWNHICQHLHEQGRL